MAPIFYLFIGLLVGSLVCAWVLNASQRTARLQLAEAMGREKLALQDQLGQQKNLAFRAFFAAFDGGAATLSDEARVVGNNRALEARLGYQPDELAGRSFLNLLHPQDIAPVQAFFLSLVGLKDGAELPRFARELRFYSQAGAILWVNLSLCPLRDADLNGEKNTFVLALLDDVTRRRQAEGTAARLGAGVHDLYRVIADRESDEHAQMKALLALGCHLFDVNCGLIGKVSGDQLEIKAAISPDLRLRVGGCYAFGDAATRKRLELPATLRHGQLRDWQTHPTIAVTQNETFLSSPIYVMGRFEGLLCFSDAQARETPFDSEQTQFCQLMALWLGAEIERRQRQNLRDQQSAALQQTNAKLEALAWQDGLTSLKNRRAFDEKLRAEFACSQKTGASLSLLLLDVDKFKTFNDTFGHPAGDVVLQRVAQILSEGVRAENTLEPAFVARYGGEEFVILLPQTSIEDALLIAERLRARLERAPWPHRDVTASFGTANFCSGMNEPAQLLSCADGALYQSKEAGRNRVTLGEFNVCAIPQRD